MSVHTADTRREHEWLHLLLLLLHLEGGVHLGLRLCLLSLHVRLLVLALLLLLLGHGLHLLLLVPLLHEQGRLILLLLLSLLLLKREHPGLHHLLLLRRHGREHLLILYELSLLLLLELLLLHLHLHLYILLLRLLALFERGITFRFLGVRLVCFFVVAALRLLITLIELVHEGSEAEDGAGHGLVGLVVFLVIHFLP